MEIKTDIYPYVRRGETLKQLKARLGGLFPQRLSELTQIEEKDDDSTLSNSFWKIYDSADLIIHVQAVNLLSILENGYFPKECIEELQDGRKRVKGSVGVIDAVEYLKRNIEGEQIDETQKEIFARGLIWGYQQTARDFNPTYSLLLPKGDEYLKCFDIGFLGVYGNVYLRLKKDRVLSTPFDTAETITTFSRYKGSGGNDERLTSISAYCASGRPLEGLIWTPITTNEIECIVFRPLSEDNLTETEMQKVLSYGIPVKVWDYETNDYKQLN